MNTIINKLPTPTWNKLKINHSSVDIDKLNNMNFDFKAPQNSKHQINDTFSFENFKTSLGEEFDKIILDSKIKIHKFDLEGKNQTLYINIDFEKENSASCVFEFLIKENSEIKIIMDFYNTLDNAALAFIQSRFKLEKNAFLHLVQVQRTKNNFSFINDIASTNAEKSNFKLSKLILCSKNSFDSFLIDLAEDESEFFNETLYLVDQENKLDINYLVNHYGKRTQSLLDIKGVLRDKAQKTFRGSIDIKQGAINASGRENEAVLLMDDTVINKSLPIILCSEEDVEGNHGATIGKLDEDILFYMQSRGIEESEIYEIIAKARIEELCTKINDEITSDKIHQFLGGSKDE